MVDFNTVEVQLANIDGEQYRLVVPDYAGCPIVQRVNHWSWHYLTDDDRVSADYETRSAAQEAAAAYRDQVDSTGGVSVLDAPTPVFVAKHGALAYKAAATWISTEEGGQGVYGNVLDPVTGDPAPLEQSVTRAVMLRADVVSAATRTNAEIALLNLARAQEGLRAAEVACSDLGEQLVLHPRAIMVPSADDLDEAERVRLLDQLTEAP